MASQKNNTTITELPAHISGHLERITRDAEAIHQKDFTALSPYGALAVRWGLVPLEGAFTEIRDGLVEGAKRYDGESIARLEAEGKKIPLSCINDWYRGYCCGEKGQKFTHPAHCLGYILRLFPEMNKDEAWHLAQAESRKRSEIKGKLNWEPTDEDKADESAVEFANKKCPDRSDWEESTLQPGNPREFIREILWNRQYCEAYRSILRTTIRLAILTVCYRGIPVRREGRVHSSSGKSASQHRQKDDGGGDGDSDQGEPPRPVLTVPSLSTPPTLTTPQRNNSTHSRTPHPCRWPMESGVEPCC